MIDISLFSHYLIAFIAAIAMIGCAIGIGRMLTELQDIFLGIDQSPRSHLKKTIKSALFSGLLFFFAPITIFSAMDGKRHITIENIIVLGILTLLLIVACILGSFWQYFIVGIYRDRLFKWLRKKGEQ